MVDDREPVIERAEEEEEENEEEEAENEEEETENENGSRVQPVLIFCLLFL